MKQCLVLRMVLIPAIFLVIFSYITAQAEGSDGYWWEEAGKTEQGQLMRQFVVVWYLYGFEYGYITREAKALFLKNARQTDRTVEDGLYFFPQVREYYVREIDSFLQEYPSCKGRQMTHLLGRLVQVWVAPQFTAQPRLSYKDIGKECLRPER